MPRNKEIKKVLVIGSGPVSYTHLTWKKGNWLPVYPGTKRQRAKNRYYYFNSKGCLCREKHFHKINKRIARRTFKGTYYFGETNGRLLRKAGWRTIGGKKYYLDSFGKRYEKRWKSGYYLQADGTIARNKQISKNVWVNWQGRKCKKADIGMSGLGKQLQKMVNSYSGTWSVYVKDLEKGVEICINDRAMYPASTIKAFVMASMFDQIKKGKLSYNSVRGLLNSMITVSDKMCIRDRLYSHRASGKTGGY